MEDQETKTTAVAKMPINISLENGIVPKDYNEVQQMSSLLYASGLAPKSLDSIEKVMIAMFMCLELGRPIITGIQDIGVINGKAGIFGDAALSMVRSSGLLEKFKEWEEGTPYTNDWTFHCLLKRKGMPDERRGVWSWEDTIRAGFDKIQSPSPWAKYTRRMMQFKARNFPLRDEFGDVLKGMRLSEDNMDAIEMYPDQGGAYDSSPSDTPTPKKAGPQQKQQDNKADKDSNPVPKPEPVKNGFQEFAAAIGNVARVCQFVIETAEANNLTITKVEDEAVKSRDGFKEAFLVWENKTYPGKEKPGQSEAKEKAPEESVVEEVSLFEELKAMRPGTSAKNKERFREVILENADEIRSWEGSDKFEYLQKKFTTAFDGEALEQLLDDTQPTTQGEELFGNTPEESQDHVPAWKRRKDFLDSMRDLHAKNTPLYFSMLKQRGFSSANDVPVEDEAQSIVLSELEGEILG